MKDEIQDLLEFNTTISLTDKIPEDISNLERDDVLQISKKGNILKDEDGNISVCKFSFEEEKYVISAKVEVYWKYYGLCVLRFKLKEVGNILEFPVLVNKDRVFQVNIKEDIMEDIIRRIKFINELFETYDLSEWFIFKENLDLVEQ